MGNHLNWNELRLLILEKADPKKAAWLEKYVKHGIKSIGLGIPELKSLLSDWLQRSQWLFTYSELEREELTTAWMAQEETEYKLLAILFLQFHWPEQPAECRLRLIEKWFDKGWIWDWNVCDWLCVRILTPLLETQPALVVPYLSSWYKLDYIWTARAALVAFAQAKNQTALFIYFHPILINHIQRGERFIKTSVGWVLREYSKHNPNFVLDFLRQYQQYATPEVLKNAKKYLK